jgi:alpha-tubulin suppressor-like RCC1 family protein
MTPSGAPSPGFRLPLFIVLPGLLAAGCAPGDGLPLGATVPDVEVRTQPLTREGIRDYRVYINFAPTSGYAGDFQAQGEVWDGIRMCLQMWQTALPELEYRFVTELAEANFVFHIDDYRPASKRAQTACGDDVMWSGCGDARTNWYNDFGGKPLGFGEKTFVTRQAYYASYQPASYPPRLYVDKNQLGLTEGEFRLGGRMDTVGFCLHEFGHSLGMTHLPASNADYAAWYGRPKRTATDTAPPAQPHVVVPDPAGSGLPNQLLFPGQDRYYGGGTPTSPWIGAFNTSHVLANTHMAGTGTVAVPPAGIPWPPLAGYNDRVLFPSDIGQVPTSYPHQWTYPFIPGVIRLTKPGSSAVYLSFDWGDAIKAAQLDRSAQTDPFFVTSVHPRASGKSRAAAGAYHTLAVRDDGTLWAWGRNNYGQLGDGGTTASTKPIRIGTATAWVAVAAGEDFSIGLRKDGTVWSWGRNTVGQLGNGSATTSRNSPDQICKTSGPACYGNRYVAIAAGKRHVLAIKNDGTLWAWGLNDRGQLGDNSLTNRSNPTQEGSRRSHWVAVAGGGAHSIALDFDGMAYGWGANQTGQLGVGDTTDRRLPTPEFDAWPWVAVAAGERHTVGLQANGSVWAWGDNTAGQLGTGGDSRATFPEPVWSSAEPFMQVAASSISSGALSRGGPVVTWGSNQFGTLGDNTFTSRPTANEVAATDVPFTQLVMGYQQAFAMHEDGQLWGWGRNTSGELGMDSSGSNLPLPQPTHFTRAAATIQLTSPGGGFEYVAPALVTITVETTGVPWRVEFFSNGTKIGEDREPPYSFTWSNVARGSYLLTAKVSDRQTSATTPGVRILVNELGQWSSAAAGSAVNLTSVGTVDWIHQGRGSAGTTNRKANVTERLGTFTESFGNVARATGTPLAVSWTDGKPTGSASNVREGLMATAIEESSGFWLSMKAGETTRRSLRIWVRAENVDVRVDGRLGNETRSFEWLNASGVRAFTIPFASGATSSTFGAGVHVAEARPGANLTILGAALF